MKDKRKGKLKDSWLVLLLWLFSASMLHAQQLIQGNRITYACSEERLSTALKAVERLSGYYKLQFTSEDVEPYRVSVRVEVVEEYTITLQREKPLHQIVETNSTDDEACRRRSLWNRIRC